MSQRAATVQLPCSSCSYAACHSCSSYMYRSCTQACGTGGSCTLPPGTGQKNDSAAPSRLP
jgi:hypothetical protein